MIFIDDLDSDQAPVTGTEPKPAQERRKSPISGTERPSGLLQWAEARDHLEKHTTRIRSRMGRWPEHRPASFTGYWAEAQEYGNPADQRHHLQEDEGAERAQSDRRFFPTIPHDKSLGTEIG
jgi:hypothetical protein